MTTSPLEAVPAQTTPEGESVVHTRVPLRLRLDTGLSSGPLDGAWWPQTRNLSVEAVDLVDHFPATLGRVQRLNFSRPDWDGQTDHESLHIVHARRGPVKVGSFPHDDTHLVRVVLGSRERLTLLVVPSDTDPDVAERLMEQASDGRNAHTAAQLLHSVSPGQDVGQLGVWDSEGGHAT